MKMDKVKRFQILFSLILVLSTEPLLACTIFSLSPQGQSWVGKTFDWSYGHGLLFTNKRNVSKQGLRLLPSDVSGSWTSKYGSVTFNQFGREFPTGGMNEMGLVVEALELKSSIFPEADLKDSLNELQFIQYLLDNFNSVESIEEGLKSIRLSPVGSRLHYFACDIKKCMTIEFINGQLSTHSSSNLPISGLANHSYVEHVDYAKDFITFGGSKPIVMNSKDSLDRFVRGNYHAKFINHFPDPAQTLFVFLNDVASKNNRWQIIYNQSEKTILFRTTAKINLQREVDLKSFDFSCQKPSLYFDLDSDHQGEINEKFKIFDSQINYQIIKKSVEMQGLPPALAGRLAIYPSETTCN